MAPIKGLLCPLVFFPGAHHYTSVLCLCFVVFKLLIIMNQNIYQAPEWLVTRPSANYHRLLNIKDIFTKFVKIIRHRVIILTHIILSQCFLNLVLIKILFISVGIGQFCIPFLLKKMSVRHSILGWAKINWKILTLRDSTSVTSILWRHFQTRFSVPILLCSGF